MTRTYRPFLAAKRGETSALGMLTAAQWANLEPVMRVPPREKDWDNGGWKKSDENHLQAVADNLVKHLGSHPFLIDMAPFGSEALVKGKHPLEWMLAELTARSCKVRCLVRPTSSVATMALARAHHLSTGLGLGAYIGPSDWETGPSPAARAFLVSAGIAASDMDVFLDAGPAPATNSAADVDMEIDSVVAGHAYRSVSSGSAGFIDSSTIPKGITLHPRTDLATWLSTRGLRLTAGKSNIDFFDYGVENPWYAPEPVNPAFISIGALFRYTAGSSWVLPKGPDLFKGPNGTSQGGKAIVPALTQLVSHALYRDVVSTPADDWIDSVVSKVKEGGNPEGWRKWASLRHVLVTRRQVSNLP